MLTEIYTDEMQGIGCNQCNNYESGSTPWGAFYVKNDLYVCGECHSINISEYDESRYNLREKNPKTNTDYDVAHGDWWDSERNDQLPICIDCGKDTQHDEGRHWTEKQDGAFEPLIEGYRCSECCTENCSICTAKIHVPSDEYIMDGKGGMTCLICGEQEDDI